MLNYIWGLMIVLSIGASVILGNTSELSSALIESGSDAVELLIKITGIICIWSGLMKIAEKSGFTTLAASLLSPLLKPLFPRLKKSDKAFHYISMNITANMLGLGNTATPLGLKAMKELQELNGDKTSASDEMVIFVVMNTASLQLLPSTLAAFRQSWGSAAPFEIMPSVWISSAAALSIALIIACSLNKASLSSKSGRSRAWS